MAAEQGRRLLDTHFRKNKVENGIFRFKRRFFYYLKAFRSYMSENLQSGLNDTMSFYRKIKNFNQFIEEREKVIQSDLLYEIETRTSILEFILQYMYSKRFRDGDVEMEYEDHEMELFKFISVIGRNLYNKYNQTNIIPRLSGLDQLNFPFRGSPDGRDTEEEINHKIFMIAADVKSTGLDSKDKVINILKRISSIPPEYLLLPYGISRHVDLLQEFLDILINVQLMMGELRIPHIIIETITSLINMVPDESARESIERSVDVFYHPLVAI